MQDLGGGGGVAHVDEQPRPGGGRGSRAPDRVRRQRQGRAGLGRLPWRSWPRCAGSRRTRPCWSSPASPWACFAPRPTAPRVLIANSNLVGRWATWEHFRKLEAENRIMYGQMTAGSWIYIGLAGDLAGDLRDLRRPRRRRGTSAARWSTSWSSPAGLGGMGGAQPLAATMNEGTCLVAEVDPLAHREAPRHGLPRRDGRGPRPGRSTAPCNVRTRAERGRSVGVACNAADLLGAPDRARRSRPTC